MSCWYDALYEQQHTHLSIHKVHPWQLLTEEDLLTLLEVDLAFYYLHYDFEQLQCLTAAYNCEPDPVNCDTPAAHTATFVLTDHHGYHVRITLKCQDRQLAMRTTQVLSSHIAEKLLEFRNQRRSHQDIILAWITQDPTYFAYRPIYQHIYQLGIEGKAFEYSLKELLSEDPSSERRTTSQRDSISKFKTSCAQDEGETKLFVCNLIQELIKVYRGTYLAMFTTVPPY